MESPHYYILTGDPETWGKSFTKNLWGFTEKRKGFWKTSNVGDFLAFYVTLPIKKIIGFGKITEKLEDNELFWPDEIRFNRAIWNYRFRFEIFYLVEDWDDGISVPSTIMLNQGRRTVDIQTYSNFLKNADVQWKTNLHSNLIKN